MESKYIRRSSGTDDLLKAMRIGRQFYEDALLKTRLNLAVHKTTFYAATQGFWTWQRERVSLGEMQERTFREDRKKLIADILPYFQTMDVADVTKREIENYLATLAIRRLTKSTLKKHVTTIKKVLTFAIETGALKVLPRMPVIGSDDRPRAYFPEEAWETVLAIADALTAQTEKPFYHVKGRPVRRLQFTDDFTDFLRFHINVALRLSDIKLLRNRNVTLKHHKDGRPYLLFRLSAGKTKSRTSIGQPEAVAAYERMTERHRKSGYGAPDDYVIYPHMPNRQTVLSELTRLFNHAVTRAGEKRDPSGRQRTLYSIRHSAIMRELLKGREIGIVARNSLTSVEMIERFYASQLQPEMCLDQLLGA